MPNVYDDQQTTSLEDLESTSAAPSATPPTGRLESAPELATREGDVESARTDNQLGRGYVGQNNTKNGNIAKVIGKKGSSLAAKKALIIGGVIGGSTLLMLLVVIVMFIGLLKIPNFAQNITTYEFARVLRTTAQNIERINAEKIAIDSASNSSYQEMSKLATASAKAGQLWSRLDKYRPNKVISNLGTSGDFTFNYETKNFLGISREQLVSITTKDKTIPIPKTSLVDRLVPGKQFLNDIKFSTDVAPQLKRALLANDIGPIIRSSVAKDIRQQLGISLIAWKIGAYRGKSQADALIQQERDSLRTISDTTAIDESLSADEKAAGKAAADAIDKAVASDTGAQSIIDNGGDVTTIADTAMSKTIVESSLKSVQGALKTAVGVANPLYEYAVPACIIYDGSLVNSAATIDAQNSQLQRTYYEVASAADQQKKGNVDGEAIGAMSTKLGDTSTGVAYKRASGSTVDTSSYQSSQASPSGDFSIADAILPPQLAPIADNAAKICPVATNIWVGAGIGAVNLAVAAILAIPTGGTDIGAEAAGSAATEAALTTTTKTITQRVIGKVFSRAALKGTVNFIKKATVQVGLTAGATFLAKFYTLTRVGSLHNGLAIGTTFQNDADAGGNLAANQLDREQNYSRPLTDQEYSLANGEDQQYIASANKEQSAYQRYIALTNPSSLASTMGLAVYNTFHYSFGTKLINAFSSLLNPLRTIGTVIGDTGLHSVFADSGVTSVNHAYGNVQFGWSPDEENLINSDASYLPVANQQALDDSGKESEINAKYSPCFDGSVTIGQLLSQETGLGGSDKYYIVRDTNGNVVSDQGLCSPDNLGLKNPTYGNLVVRWRLAHAYSNSLDNLMGMQEVTN